MGPKKGAHQNTYNTAVFSEFSTWLVGGLGVEKGAGARGVGLLFSGGGGFSDQSSREFLEWQWYRFSGNDNPFDTFCDTLGKISTSLIRGRIIWCLDDPRR